MFDLVIDSTQLGWVVLASFSDSIADVYLKAQHWGLNYQALATLFKLDKIFAQVF